MASYRFLHDDASVTTAVRRIAATQVERSLEEIDEAPPHEAVHQVRKRAKKVRALVRLVRPEAPDLYERENTSFRDTGRLLSDLRDAASDVETVDLLRDRLAVDEGEPVTRPAFERVRAALVERRDAMAADHLDAALGEARERLEAARARIEGWTVDADGWAAMEGGFAKTLGRFHDRFVEARDEPTSEGWHEWRKRVKYHRYQCRLLQDSFPAALSPRRRALHDLSDLVGDDNDLWELRGVLMADPERLGGEDAVATVVAHVDRQRAALQREALVLGARLAAGDPDDLVERVGAWWQVWRSCPRTVSAAEVEPVIPVAS